MRGGVCGLRVTIGDCYPLSLGIPGVCHGFVVVLALPLQKSSRTHSKHADQLANPLAGEGGQACRLEEERERQRRERVERRSMLTATLLSSVKAVLSCSQAKGLEGGGWAQAACSPWSSSQSALHCTDMHAIGPTLRVCTRSLCPGTPEHGLHVSVRTPQHPQLTCIPSSSQPLVPWEIRTQPTAPTSKQHVQVRNQVNETVNSLP